MLELCAQSGRRHSNARWSVRIELDLINRTKLKELNRFRELTKLIDGDQRCERRPNGSEDQRKTNVAERLRSGTDRSGKIGDQRSNSVLRQASLRFALAVVNVVRANQI